MNLAAPPNANAVLVASASMIGPTPPVISAPPVISPALLVPRRLESLDVLRGFAVLGILLMNIQSFSMIDAAYNNPAAFGDLTTLNRWVWLLSHVFADQKFMTIFSLLFGAGIALSAQKLRAQGKPHAWLHYRRMFWLLVIGLAHAYVFWHGDILVSYAIAGSIAFLFRNVRPGWLTLWGSLALAVPLLLFLAAGLSMPFWPADSIQEITNEWAPPQSEVIKQIANFRGGFTHQLNHRAPAALMVQTVAFLVYTGWQAGGLMLLGMALLRWAVLTGDRSCRSYLKLTLLGAAIGFPLVLYGVHRNFEEAWSLRYSMFIGSLWNYVGSLGVAMAYVASLMLLLRIEFLRRIRKALQAVGRMSLSNYLLQTLICSTLFFGHGFGLYGQLQRWEQVLVVLGVWAVQIALSIAWLRRFTQGPGEWLWRTLTFCRVQPLLCNPAT